jgi:protein-S-isoprenylcysteine O-methyltransferase Ste14
MLRDDMARQGHWLFSWRSYLPLIIIPAALTVFPQSGWMGDLFGELFEEGYDLACFALAMTGVAVRVLTVGFVPAGTSGRNTGTQRADALNITGIYSVVRHPLYFANFLTFIGVVLTIKSGLFVLFASCAYLLYYERIMLAEEQFLDQRYGETYRRWAARTPAFLPRLTGLVAPALPFSWRTALRREFHGVFLLATLFLVSELAESIFIEGHTFAGALVDEWIWVTIFIVSAVFYITVMTVKKRTRWLEVAGR